MRQGKFLFVILSLVGAQNVLGQWSLGNPTITSSNVGIGTTTSATFAKLHAISNSGPSAIFQNATTTSGAGNVGIGGLSTSFTNTLLPSNLLHLRDGNMFVQRGTLRVSSLNATDDALWVSNGRANLTGGVYAGVTAMGIESYMQYVPSSGLFEIKTVGSPVNIYDFKIGSIVNNVNLSSPVLSTTTNMNFQVNSGLSATVYNFKFLNGNTELATLTNTGSLGIGTVPATSLHIKGPVTTIARIETATWNTVGAGNIAKLELGDLNHFISGTWGAGLKLSTFNSIVFSAGAPISLDRMKIDGATGNVTIANRVDIGDKKYLPTDVTVKLGVAGTIVAQKVKVTAATNWGDFVFDKRYTLQPLAEVEQYVQANKHLPNIPSATELEENGLDTGEMLRLQMIKIEELTLHLITQQKEMQEMKTQLENLRSK